jgi:paraquat-inducible protein B
MSLRVSHATRIGLFVVSGIAVVVAAVLLTAGGKLFTRKDRTVMHFSGSIYGLQVGAPVVFRGVRLGNVTSIGLVYDSSRDQFTIPVTADIDRNTIRNLQADGRLDKATLSLPALIEKGLRAQLAMQSFLTGQLYVDLDLRPDKPGSLMGHDPQVVEIPTSATAIQNLKAQLDGIDFRKLMDDVSAMATTLRQTASGPALQQTLGDLRQLSANLRRLSERLDRRVDPLADAAQGTLADTRALMKNLGTTNEQVRDTARRFGGTAEAASALLAADSPTVLALQRSAEELSQAAAALRAQASGDAPLAQNLDRALQDVSRAARAVRQLADGLEQQPQSLLRGRQATPAPAAEPQPNR